MYAKSVLSGCVDAWVFIFRWMGYSNDGAFYPIYGSYVLLQQDLVYIFTHTVKYKRDSMCCRC
jgi:hypothetical protein